MGRRTPFLDSAEFEQIHFSRLASVLCIDPVLSPRPPLLFLPLIWLLEILERDLRRFEASRLLAFPSSARSFPLVNGLPSSTIRRGQTPLISWSQRYERVEGAPAELHWSAASESFATLRPDSERDPPSAR